MTTTNEDVLDALLRATGALASCSVVVILDMDTMLDKKSYYFSEDKVADALAVVEDILPFLSAAVARELQGLIEDHTK